MPTETLERPLAEASTVDPEVAGRLLGLLVSKRAQYHKGRILETFDEGKLPSLPTNSTANRLEESDRRYRKVSGLLYHEEPSQISDLEAGITGPLLTSLADNLAWKGIEYSMASSHTTEMRAAIGQMKASHQPDSRKHAFDLIRAQRAVKAIAIEDGHFYRDFFDSDLASSLGVDSPTNLRRFLKASFLAEVDPEAIEHGISLEIASRRYIDSLLSSV